MKYVDEYRDQRLARALAGEISRRATRDWTLMEICGGQTHTILRYGLDELLPARIRLLHGPGCPVCVTPLETIDKALALAARPEITLVSYGDMLRVPGARSDLLHLKAAGGDVRVVYSPMDAVRIAAAEPRRQVVFFAVGFETTAPANAMAVWQARRLGVENFFLLVSQALVPPAIRLLLRSPHNRVQGLIAPGHVCTIAGYQQYEQLAQEFRLPIVVGGFEPVDLLEAIAMLVEQLESGKAVAANQYARSVTYRGNTAAQQIVHMVFEVCDRQWRGLGVIPQSGLRLRPVFAPHDAEKVFGLEEVSVPEPSECIGAQVLQGRKRPTECAAFAGRCTPQTPLGALMVSAEGACAAYYHYRRQPPPPARQEHG
jgi:hydrogenase expression/formation protein HypD